MKFLWSSFNMGRKKHQGTGLRGVKLECAHAMYALPVSSLNTLYSIIAIGILNQTDLLIICLLFGFVVDSVFVFVKLNQNIDKY